MKNLFTILLLSTFTTYGQIQTSEILIEKGTTLKVRSMSNFQSNKVVEGDELEFEVYEDLVINDQIVIKVHTPVKAYVESVEKAKGMGKEGILIIQITSTKSIDNKLIPLRIFKSSIYGEDKSDKTILLSSLIGPQGYLLKGGQASVKEGKIFNTYITKDVKVKFQAD